MEQRGSNPIPSKARLLGLDILRLLAVVLVMGRHMPSPPESWPAVARLPLLTWIQGGWVGVDLFFVLSGFLVSGLLFAEYKSRGKLEVSRFYMRRAWKIYPPFFTLIVATIALQMLCGHPIPLSSLASECFFLQSYVPSLWNHTWSLAVEEHFYVLLPLVLALILRWNRDSPTPMRPVLTVAAVVAVASLALRVLNWYMRPLYHHLTHHFASHLRLDSMLFGVAISYAYHFHRDTFAWRFTLWRRTLFVGGGMLLAPAFVLRLESTPSIYTVGLSAFYFGSGMMLVGVLLSQLPLRRSVALLAALGAYSYSIYLWHMPILVWGVPLVERVLGVQLEFGAVVAVYFGGSFCLGIVMAKLVEVPALRLRDRWFPSHSPCAVGTGPNQTLQKPTAACSLSEID